MKLRPLWLLSLLTVPLVAQGCSSDPEPAMSWIPATLRSVGSCEQLESALKVDALLRMDWAIDAHIAQYLERDRSDLWSFGSVDDVAAEAAGTGQAAPTESGPPDHSETNVQVEGVDEADIVKTDGTYIYALHGRSFAVVQAWPPTELELASAAPMEGLPVEMFVTEGHAVVFSLLDGTPIFEEMGLAPREVPARYGYYASPGLAYYYPVMTKVTTLTLDGPTATVEREMYIEGQYLSSRRVDNHIRAIITGGPEGPPLPTWTSGYDSSDVDALESQRNANEARIHQSQLSDWVAHRFVREGGTLRGLATDCSCYYLPTPGSTSTGHTQIYSFELDRPTEEPAETHVMGHAETVYSTEDTLVIATEAFADAVWIPSDVDVPVSKTGTHLHLFDLTEDPARPIYVASGSVPGRLHNQFSIDEHDGFLRVATTDWLGGSASGQANNVFVTERSGAEVRIVGQVTGIAPWEDIKAVRFVGDRGYVVTFRQVDPLFVVDLSTPTAPVVVGQLEIPGFSEYMHPIDDGNYLITIGQGDGWGGQPALQLFDVRNPLLPTLVDKLQLPAGTSEAEYNHKAITFYHDMFVLPHTSWDYEWSSALGLYTVDLAAGQIVELGSVDHSQLFDGVTQTYYDACSGWGYDGVSMRRGVFIDETLYALSPAGITAQPIADLATPTATLLLPQMDPIDCSFTYGQDWDWGWR